jgi:hypothetical protein
MRVPDPNRRRGRRYCPDLTELAAFLDGNGLPWKRRQTMEHLNGCLLCYTVFIETVRCQTAAVEAELA